MREIFTYGHAEPTIDDETYTSPVGAGEFSPQTIARIDQALANIATRRARQEAAAAQHTDVSELRTIAPDITIARYFSPESTDRGTH